MKRGTARALGRLRLIGAQYQRREQSDDLPRYRRTVRFGPWKYEAFAGLDKSKPTEDEVAHVLRFIRRNSSRSSRASFRYLTVSIMLMRTSDCPNMCALRFDGGFHVFCRTPVNGIFGQSCLLL